MTEPTARDWDEAREHVRKRNEELLTPLNDHGRWQEIQSTADAPNSPRYVATLRHTDFEGDYRTYERDTMYAWIEEGTFIPLQQSEDGRLYYEVSGPVQHFPPIEG